MIDCIHSHVGLSWVYIGTGVRMFQVILYMSTKTWTVVIVEGCMLDAQTILPSGVYVDVCIIHVPQVHISRLSYVSLGQMDVFATYPSPFLDPCMAYIRTHVRIYLSHNICVYICVCVCVQGGMLDVSTILPGVIYEHVFVNSRSSYVYFGGNEWHIYEHPFVYHYHIVGAYAQPYVYVYKFMDVEHTLRWYLRTHVCKLLTILCV